MAHEQEVQATQAPEEAPDDLELPDEQADQVRGGKPPTPGGPIPIPYPN